MSWGERNTGILLILAFPIKRRNRKSLLKMGAHTNGSAEIKEEYL